MSAISSLKIDNNVYDIYAKSAISSNFANSANTARNGNFFEDSLGGVPATWNSASTYAVGAKITKDNYCYSANAAAPTGEWSAVSSKFTRLPQVVWTINDTSITGLYKGLQLWVKIPSYGGSSGSNATMLSINGSANKQIRYNNGNYTTHYGVNSIVHMTYDGTYFQVGDRDTNNNDKVTQNRTTSNTAYPIILKTNNTTANVTDVVRFNESFTYNPSSSLLLVKNISGVNMTAATFSGNLSGSASSAISAGNSTNLGGHPSGYYSLSSHSHDWKISGNGTGIYVSGGVNIIPSGSYIKVSTSGKNIILSSQNTNTDIKVEQKKDTSNSELPLILKNTSGGTDVSAGVKYCDKITINPSSHTLTINDANNEEGVVISPTRITAYWGELHNASTAYISDIIDVTSYFTNDSAKKADTATNANKVSSTHTGNNANYYLEFIDSTANGYKKLYHNTGLQYNPSAHILYNSGSSATIVNGDDNTVTIDKQRFNFINGITNTVSTATNTRITSGVGLFGSNNTALGLKNGAIIGTNIKVSGNNNAGYNISNILFLGDNNAIENLNQYENAKLIISQGKTWGGTLHGTDVFAIKGGGSVWTNVLKRNTEDVFDCNGHNDIIYNYAPMYKMPVASPTQDQTYHYNANYGINDNYLVVSHDGFLVPTDITISKTTDTLLGADAAARMVLINLVAGKDTQGTITVGQDAPGYLTVAKGGGSTNPDAHVTFGDTGPVTAFYGVNYGMTKIQYGGCNDFTDYIGSNGSLQGIAYIDSKLLRTDVNYSIGSTKNNYTKSAGEFHGHLGNSYAAIDIANETYFPYASLSANNNLTHCNINITNSGSTDINIATAVLGQQGTNKVYANIKIGNPSNLAGRSATRVQIGGHLSAYSARFPFLAGNYFTAYEDILIGDRECGTDVYTPNLKLGWGYSSTQESTFSSDAPKILFVGGNATTAENVSAALAFSYYNTPKRYGSTANHASLAGGWFDFSLRDGGDGEAGVLADCFSAKSGMFSNATASKLTATNFTAQNATARNLAIISDFWNSPNNLKTFACDCAEFYTQNSYEMGGQSTGSPDGLMRTGRIKSCYFASNNAQTAKMSLMYTFRTWLGTTFKFRTFGNTGINKSLQLYMNDMDRPVNIHYSQTSTTKTLTTSDFPAGTPFTLTFNASVNTAAPSLRQRVEEGMNVTMTTDINNSAWCLWVEYVNI